MTFQSASALKLFFLFVEIQSLTMRIPRYINLQRFATREKKSRVERGVQVLNCNFEANPNSKSPGVPSSCVLRKL